MRLKARHRPRLLALACAGLLLLATDAIFAPPVDRADDVSTVVLDQEGQWLSAFPVEDGRWRLKADLDEIDPVFIERLIRIEDERFWEHSGVDGPAVVRAAKSWAQAGEIVSGASTITMQLARALEPRPRTFKSKMLESFRAVQFEKRLTKTQILEYYLTHTPYGGNIEGVNAASLAYFGHTPDRLTDAEIALLIALPQAPEARRPDINPKAAKAARNRILERLVVYGMLSETRAAEAASEDILTSRHDLPELAWLEADHAADVASKAEVKLTLDARLQSDLESLMSTKAATVESDVNFSVMVVENETGKVKARLGSAGRDRAGGWIDMTRRLRSPGSTLKPFIYGVAFDDGVAAPGTLINDAPTVFGGYQPENFGRAYSGDVRLSDALAHSLNIPAVYVLEDVGTDRFKSALGASGAPIFTPKQAEKREGLALALGGGGMTPESLAILYHGLATGGTVKPLLIFEDQDLQDRRGYQLMSEDSARKITNILRQAPTPPGHVPHWLAENAPAIAYKTGTSYGFRDAWAAGYTDDWTVIVWTGKPDGTPRPGHTGREIAAPILFEIFSKLEQRARSIYVYSDAEDSPLGLMALQDSRDAPPHIIFPENDTEIAVNALGPKSRGIVLSARTDTDTGANWYVNGKPVEPENTSGKVIWRPASAGFYTLRAVDGAGRTSISHVRVILN